MTDAGRLEERVQRIDNAMLTASVQLEAMDKAIGEITDLAVQYQHEQWHYRETHRHALADIRFHKVAVIKEILEVIEKHMRVAQAVQRANVA